MRIEIEPKPASPPLAEQSASTNDISAPVSEAQEHLRNGIKAAQSGDRARARTELLRAAEMDPQSENAWLWLASISEYPEELLVFLNNVLDINPENSRALEWREATNSLLAKTLIQRGIDAAEENHNEQASEYFSKALEYDQQSAMAWMWLASLSDSNDGKLLYLEKALAIEPENRSARAAYQQARNAIAAGHLSNAKAAAVAGRTAEAHELLNAVLEEMPDSEDAWMLRSHFAESFDEKIRSFERVLQINPKNAAAAASLESLRSLVGDADASAATTEQKADEVATAPSEGVAAAEAALFDGDVYADKSPTQDLEMPPGVAEAFGSVEPEQEVQAPAEDPFLHTVYQATVDAVVAESAPFTEPVFDQPQAEASDAGIGSPEAEDDGYSNGSASFYGTQSDDPSIDEVRFVNEAPAADPFASEAEPSSDGFDPFMTMYSMSSMASVFDEAAASFDGDSIDEPAGDSPEAIAEEFRTEASSAAEPAFEDGPYVSESVFIPAGDPFGGEVPEYTDSIPMPDAAFPMADLPSAPTGFETTVERPRSASQSMAECAFCGNLNESQAISCVGCRAVFTLADLEMILNNSAADQGPIRDWVDAVEGERSARPLDDGELKMLGIAHLNLRNLDAGHACLLEASRRDPNDVVLSSQVNALLIRIQDIRRQQETQGSLSTGKRILVVDDSPTIRKLISGKLEKCGHDVYCSADGVEAMERLAEFVPDLVLLDITMPRMDGYQVCKLIRSTESTKDIPVVMISGKDGFFDKVRGRMVGTSGYITKPFGPETLMKVVESYLNDEQQIAVEQ